jgi:hypothetical protein
MSQNCFTLREVLLAQLIYLPESKKRLFPDFQILKMKGFLGFECGIYIDDIQRFTF